MSLGHFQVTPHFPILKQRPAHSGPCLETLRDHPLQLSQGQGHGLCLVLQLQLQKTQNNCLPRRQRLQLFFPGTGFPTALVGAPGNSLLAVTKVAMAESDGSNTKGLVCAKCLSSFIPFNPSKSLMR